MTNVLMTNVLAKAAEFIVECRKGGTTAEALEKGEKLGYDTGLTVKHPLNPDWELPVWVANFILMDYGRNRGPAGHAPDSQRSPPGL